MIPAFYVILILLFVSVGRLWAASGQAALESSRILVISASATSTSILKNLVLPGIGHFTILDPNTVSPADAGNNFFLNGFSSIGRSRAEEAVPLLKELNDSVDGEAVVKNIQFREQCSKCCRTSQVDLKSPNEM